MIKKQKVFIYFYLNISTFSAACFICWRNSNSAIGLTPQILGLKAVFQWLQTSVKQSLFSLWLSSVARVKEVATATCKCAGLKAPACTPILVIQHPSHHLGKCSRLVSVLFACSFYHTCGEAWKSHALLSVVEQLLVLPCCGDVWSAPALIDSLSQHRILLLGLECGHADFIFSLN